MAGHRERMVTSAALLIRERGARPTAIADGLDRDGATDLATTVIAALEGALVMARAERDVAPLDAVHRQLHVLLDAATTKGTR